jgi:hypothetical protein
MVENGEVLTSRHRELPTPDRWTRTVVAKTTSLSGQRDATDSSPEIDVHADVAKERGMADGRGLPVRKDHKDGRDETLVSGLTPAVTVFWPGNPSEIRTATEMKMMTRMRIH